MIAALLSFLGGNIFRMMFGEVVAFLNKRQEHTHSDGYLFDMHGALARKKHAWAVNSPRDQARFGCSLP